MDAGGTVPVGQDVGVVEAVGTAYVVLEAADDDGDTWTEAGGTAGASQGAALRAWLNRDGATLVDGRTWYALVPARSWNPTPVDVEARPTVTIGGV